MIYFQRLSILLTKIFVNSYPTQMSVRFGISWSTDSVSPSLPNFSWGEEGLYTGYISLGINFVQLVQNKQYTRWGPQVVIRSTFLSSLDFLAHYNWPWPQTNYRIYIRGVILGYKFQVSTNQFRFGLKVFFSRLSEVNFCDQGEDEAFWYNSSGSGSVSLFYSCRYVWFC